jgi:hypothetical protein
MGDTMTSQTRVTADELNAILGDRWYIARKTASNIRKFAGARLITRKEYAAAQQTAIARRGANVVRLSDYR